MTWLQRYRLRHFLRFSFWVVPVGWMVAAVIAMRAVHWLDQQTGWSWLDFGLEGARQVLAGLSSSMLTFVVFALSSLLLIVQLASGQLTSRIIALTFSVRMVKVAVGVFAFTYSGFHSCASRIVFPFALSVAAPAAQSKSGRAGLRLRFATLRLNGK